MRGILGVVLSACLLVGCGGVEEGVASEALGQQEQEVSSCEDLDACFTEGATTRCYLKPSHVFTCRCQGGYWNCT